MDEYFRTAAGQLCPVLTRKQAQAAGLAELTLPIRINSEAEILAEIAGNFAKARIAWALVLCRDDADYPCAAIWRADMRTHEEAKQERNHSAARYEIRPDHYQPRAAALA